MDNIIAGRFDQQSLVAQAREEMLRAGFSEKQVTTFYVNPPGQHDLYPIGGDENESAGAEDSEKGLAKGGITGGVVGALIGAATIPVIGPVGPIAGALLGAHVGDLAGTFHEMKDDGSQAEARGLPYHRAGMMLAVSVNDAEEEHRAINILRALHAQDIERAQGTITDGDWQDFNPLRPPALVEHSAR